MGIHLNATNRQSVGSFLHYYFNYSSAEAKLTYPYAPGANLLDNKPVAQSQQLTLPPWDLAIVEESTPAH